MKKFKTGNLKTTKRIALALVIMLMFSTMMRPIPVFGGADELSDKQKEFVLKYYQIAVELAVDHNMPWQIAMAQGIVESGAGTTDLAVYHNNFFGITKPGGGFQHFETPEAGWQGYFDNIQNTKVYSRNGIYETFDDPERCVEVLYASGYAEDPLYVEKVTAMFYKVEKFRLEMGLLSSAEYYEKIETEAQEAWEQNEIEYATFRAELESIGKKAQAKMEKRGRSGVTLIMSGLMAEYHYVLTDETAAELITPGVVKIIDTKKIFEGDELVVPLPEE